MLKPLSFSAFVVAILLVGCFPSDNQLKKARPADQAMNTPATVAPQREEAAKPVSVASLAAAPPLPAEPVRSWAQPLPEGKLATSSAAPAGLAGHSQELDALR
ncbi:MAG TPA: hypothetical protein PLM32_15810, partial [Candidatus Competibacter sp.]|nr:hypothetical protein [Candidatus Competibacter sp.]